jgi:hypothetical protein
VILAARGELTAARTLRESARAAADRLGLAALAAQMHKEQ